MKPTKRNYLDEKKGVHQGEGHIKRLERAVGKNDE